MQGHWGTGHTNREPRGHTVTCKIQAHRFHRTGLFSALRGAQGQAQGIPNGHIHRLPWKGRPQNTCARWPGKIRAHTRCTDVQGTHRTNMPPPPTRCSHGNTPKHNRPAHVGTHTEQEHVYRDTPGTRGLRGTHRHTKFTDTQIYLHQSSRAKGRGTLGFIKPTGIPTETARQVPRTQGTVRTQEIQDHLGTGIPLTICHRHTHRARAEGRLESYTQVGGPLVS